jgi:hypothetical protein
VFRFAFNPSLFQWKNPEGQVSGDHSTFAYRPSISGLPDMPYWMRYKYSHRHKAGKNIITFVFIKIVNIVEKIVL